MKPLAITLNLIAFITINYFFIDEIGYLANIELLVYILLFVTPVINVIVILKHSESSWLSLYFKRKHLEEQRRIDELSK